MAMGQSKTRPLSDSAIFPFGVEAEILYILEAPDATAQSLLADAGR
jgi:hypothetical protein